MFKNGYAEKVSMPDPADGSEIISPVWYIPHHGLFHPKKPSKIQVVFDCSAVVKGESLSKHLLQGPDLTNNLPGVLCRFRRKRVRHRSYVVSGQGNGRLQGHAPFPLVGKWRHLETASRIPNDRPSIWCSILKLHPESNCR